MTPSLLSVYGLTVHFRDLSVVEDLSFDLQRGKVLAIVGPNGSGKSTLLKTIAGIRFPWTGRYQGQIRYLGADLMKQSPRERASKVVYLGSEMLAEFPLSAGTVVGLGGHRVREAMEFAECLDLKSRDILTLSGGERQRVALARAIAQDSNLLLLDESMSKMDYHHQHLIAQRLRGFVSGGKGVILVSHDLTLAARYSDDVLLLRSGHKLVSGPTKEILNQKYLSALYPGAPDFDFNLKE